MTSNSSRVLLRTKLEQLFKEHRRLEYPPPNQDEVISDLNDLLEPYDSYVASAIMRILKGEQTTPYPPHVSGLEEEPKLQRKIDRLVSDYSPETRIGQIARQYSDYYGHIKRMLQIARSYLESSAE